MTALDRGRPHSALVAVLLLLGIAVRLHSPSGLWLDESLSVDIARLPVPDLLHAVRRDGSPPFYYLLLHGWMALFGEGRDAVRALSVLLSCASLPLAYLVGRRYRDGFTGLVLLGLLASSPFAVRYATETRMYALVMLLVLLGLLALRRAWLAPTPWHLLPVALLSGLLLLTHYWALYLLAVVGASLLVLAVTGPHPRRGALRLAVAVASGLVLFLPWLPAFLFQAQHTGTPWAPSPPDDAVTATVASWNGGATWAGGVLTPLVWGLLVLGACARRRDGAVVLGRPTGWPALAGVVGVGVMVVGTVAGQFSTSGFVPRYSAVAIAPFLLAVAAGVSALDTKARTLVGLLLLVTGGYGAVLTADADDRTQADAIAGALAPALQSRDLVVFCPDQTGPAVSRLLPSSADQVMYPTFSRPGPIDWTDYAQRNESASPQDFADRALARTGGRIWLVASSNHLTFGNSCDRLADALARARGGREVVQPENPHYRERDSLTWFPARA